MQFDLSLNNNFFNDSSIIGGAEYEDNNIQVKNIAYPN